MTATLPVRCGNCPNPANCSPTFCHFQAAELETPHDIAARHFWDASPPGYYEVIDAPGNWLDKHGLFGRACAVAALIAACAFVGVVVLV